MTELKNSPLLDRLLEVAEYIGDRPGVVTASRFFATVLVYVEHCREKRVNDSESQGLVDLIDFSKFDPTAVKNKLLSLINMNETPAPDEIDCLNSAMSVASELALRKDLPVLPAVFVMGSILEAPSEAIQKIIGAPTEEVRVDSDDIKIGMPLDELFEELKMDLPSSIRMPGATPTQGSSWDEPNIIARFGQTEQEPQSDEPTEKSEPTAPEGSKKAVAELVARVKTMRETIQKTVFGQDNAVNVVMNGYFQSELLAMTDKKRTRPRATFLFAGPPGVGKTFLSETLAELIELPYMRFDMSEYSDKEASIEFCGSDNVYKNGKEGNVTGFVNKNHRCVLLFDEIEKAHISVIHLFLQMLDAGRLRDNFLDIEVPFTDAIIIMTTNAGKQLYQESESGDLSSVSRKVILKALEKDVDPETGTPFFPAAICSRFASGNVVMFNHMGAHDLRSIAKKEVLRHAKNFENEIGIKISIDEKVFTAIMFAEGGAADARTIRARAATFFDDELFELFRLVTSDKVGGKIESLNTISIDVSLPENDPELLDLFESKANPEVMLYASEKTAASCVAQVGHCTVHHVQSISEAAELLNTHDIKTALIDLTYGQKKNSDYLNIEDIDSKARDFFHFIRENKQELPIYLLETDETTYNAEERNTFARQGVRGVLSTSGAFGDQIDEICASLHQQSAMMKLARSNKLVKYETAQTISKDGKDAQITLFDFETALAVDAEDSGNILSNVSKPNVSFDEVIGADDAKKELRYFVEYLKNPKKFLGTGVRAPKGVLLYGPPGTGKTMLAKAMANESDVTFITAEGNQFLKKYVGEGTETVHELFRTARKYAPSILFIDEIDAIAKERRGGENAGSTEATLTAFLTEMDGFKSDPNKPVFVLAATNFDVEPGGAKSLDPALMRRFDRRVYIDLPDRDDRVRYIKLKISRNAAFAISDAKIDSIAMRSTGMSLAELESVIEMALRTALRDGNGKVTDEVFDEAFETFNGGEVKKWDASQLERVARHEAGHAFLCWQSGETPSYLTIVARGNHGGYMQHADEEGKAIYTKEELYAKIRTSLGGRAAELVYYGEKDGLSTGASGDLVSATRMAQRIICSYGMDETFGLAVIDGEAALRGELSAEVRDAVNKILSDEMEKAIALISANKRAIDALVDLLLRKNHLTGSEIHKVLVKATR